MVHHRNIALAGAFSAVATAASVTPLLAQTILGFTNPAGYSASLSSLPAGSAAISAGGRLAVAKSDFNGHGVVEIYDHAEGPRTLIATLNAPAGAQFQFFGGLKFTDENTVVFGENGLSNTVFSGSVLTGTTTALAPLNSTPFVDDVAVRPADGSVFALAASNPGSGAIFHLSGGAASTLVSGFGVGYLAGIDFAPDGSLLVGDTNDPTFSGNSGLIYKLTNSGSIAQTISLAGGGGSGLADFTVGPDGNLYATTGSTLTEVLLGASSSALNFGTFGGAFPFPTGVFFTGSNFAPNSGGDAALYVNGQFTNVGGLFRITPNAVPEPGVFALLIASGGATGFLRVRRNSRKKA